MCSRLQEKHCAGNTKANWVEMKGVFALKAISVLEWNINQRGGKGRGNIPPWVKDEINGYDIVILTEFCTGCDGRAAFISELEQRGYHCAVSDNSNGNDILIAINACFSILNSTWVPCYGMNSFPENLRVDIDCDGSPLTAMGIRIKTLDNFKMRKQEFKWVLEQIRDLKHPILMAGDFNHGKRGSRNQDWSISIMEDMLKGKGFTLYTPEGSSIYGVENYNGNEFPDDYFAAKGATITLRPYDRDFTSRNPSAYPFGRDFQELWYPGARDGDLAKIASSFPDHAILKGNLCFPLQKE